MSEDGGELDKSEDASPFKLMRMRRRGVVARGMDLGFLSAIAAATGYFSIWGDRFRAGIAQAARQTLVSAANVNDGSSELLALTGRLLAEAARPLAFFIATIFVSVLVLELLQTGFIFSTEAIRLDFSRLNPTQNFKRIFSRRVLVETGKSVLKLISYVVAAYLVIAVVKRLAPVAINDAAQLGQALVRYAQRLLLYAVAIACGFALIDQLIARRDFGRRMRMSRRELKREIRDREGDARLGQRRKQLHAEFAKVSQSMKNIKGADLLITNPTHLAVALKYRPAEMEAPIVVSRGANQMAQRLRRLSFLYGLIIVEDKPLAKLLYHRCDLNQPIPDAAYQRVANIYLAMRAKEPRD